MVLAGGGGEPYGTFLVYYGAKLLILLQINALVGGVGLCTCSSKNCESLSLDHFRYRY